MSVCLFFLTGNEGLYVGIVFLLFSLLTITTFLFVEPVFIIINSQGITAVGAFKRYCVEWKQIEHINVKYDPFFSVLDVRDYVLIVRYSFRFPYRFLRIVRCCKTQVLMKQYAPVHLINMIK